MFEKEAEEYKDNKGKKRFEEMDTIAEFATMCFKDGAEFGYNKVNEWHKYSERPKEKINALCLDTEQNRLILGFYDLEADEWLRYGGYETIHIDLWKEIVLPELPERIKQDDR